jgi:hypothetical protein
MRPLHFALLLTGCLGFWQTRGFAQTQPLNTNASALAANSLLNKAIQALSRPEGVEVHFRHELIGQTEPLIAVGRSITAANNHVFVELNVQQVRRTAQLKLYSDGSHFHRVETIDPAHMITSYPLKEMNEALDRLAVSETERIAREDVEKELRGVHGLDGLAAMVKDLKQRAVFTQPKSATIDLGNKKGVAVQVIEGRWNKETLDALAPPKSGDNPAQRDLRYLWNEKLDFFYVPRSAKVYFDATSQNLLRIELLGIHEKQGPEQVLTSIAFESITPVPRLEEKMFQPTEAELKYEKQPLELTTQVKELYQRTLNNLKRQEANVSNPAVPGKPNP